MSSGITIVPVGEHGSSYGVLGSRCDPKTGDNEKAPTGPLAAIGMKPPAKYSGRKSRVDGAPVRTSPVATTIIRSNP